MLENIAMSRHRFGWRFNDTEPPPAAGDFWLHFPVKSSVNAHESHAAFNSQISLIYIRSSVSTQLYSTLSNSHHSRHSTFDRMGIFHVASNFIFCVCDFCQLETFYRISSEGLNVTFGVGVVHLSFSLEFEFRVRGKQAHYSSIQ